MLKVSFTYANGHYEKLFAPFAPDKKEKAEKSKVITEFLKAHYYPLEFEIEGVYPCITKGYFNVIAKCINRTGRSALISYSLAEFFKRDHLAKYGFVDYQVYFEDDTDLFGDYYEDN